MNIATTLLAVSACVSAQAQVQPLRLPMDNNSTVSFMDCVPGEGSNAWLLCERVEESEYATTSPLVFNNMFSVRIESFVLSGGRYRVVTGEGVVYTSCGNLGYTFTNYRVDGAPIEKWELGKSVPELEAVRGEVFLRTVEAIARMRGGWRGQPSRLPEGVASAPE